MRHAEQGGYVRQEARGRAERARQRRRGRKEGEKKRGREIRGDDREGWSRVGDKRPCDAGWDGGEEKERRVRSAGKEQMNTLNGIRCWKNGGSGQGKVSGN